MLSFCVSPDAGLRAVMGASPGGPALCRLHVRCRPSGAGAEATVAARGAPENLDLGLAVAPSGEPASLRLLRDGVPLPSCAKVLGPG